MTTPTDNTAKKDAAPENEKELTEQLNATSKKIRAAREQIGRVIYGQQNVVDQALVTLLSGGHMLLIGLPGLGKTRLVETISTVTGLGTKRIQCTPDLMPADIIGSEVMVQSKDGERSFRFIEGPVFCQLLMADEINRASPRTQSALLQAMQEYHVSVGGQSHDLPRPFHVLATQNPLEQEGTYPLPEAQLDRFLMQIDVTYPDSGEERAMILSTTGANDDTADQVLSDKELMEAQALIRKLPVGEKVVDGIIRLVQSGRPDQSEIDAVKKHVSWGPGPRASQALMLASRAKALMEGRLSPSMDDVLALARPVLKHRMALNFSARAEGIGIDDVIDKVCEPFA